MRKLQYSNFLLMMFACLVFGCKGTDGPECFAGGIYHALQIAWPKYVAHSSSCYSAHDLMAYDDGCRVSFDSLRRCGYELEWVYKLSDWFLLRIRDSRDCKTKYFKLRRNSVDGSIECMAFELQDGVWIDISVYACSLRFAPIVADAIVGFTEMWDSQTDEIVCVPSGFHGLIQGGLGKFLLRSDSDGLYYRWDAVSRAAPEPWKYEFPVGYNVRSNFFIAKSVETGKSYAFAVGLEPIPNSEDASAISPCGAYKGRHFYKFWKGCNGSARYYAWPEKDRSEPLSNGTESFGGHSVVVRNGKLVVLSSAGAVDVFEAPSA